MIRSIIRGTEEFSELATQQLIFYIQSKNIIVEEDSWLTGDKKEKFAEAK